jgi:hypothetical protein
MDASTLRERFTVLSISVVYRGCGIPIARKSIKAQQEGEWRPYWEGLLTARPAAYSAASRLLPHATYHHLSISKTQRRAPVATGRCTQPYDSR